MSTYRVMFAVEVEANDKFEAEDQARATIANSVVESDIEFFGAEKTNEIGGI